MTPPNGFGGDGTSQLTCALVRFTPGARTNWHSHVNGQLLVCTDGTGLGSTRDGKTVVLRAGEGVWSPAGEATTWLEPVTEEQYLAAHRTAGV